MAFRLVYDLAFVAIAAIFNDNQCLLFQILLHAASLANLRENVTIFTLKLSP
jgi:hypothetical protein